MNNDEIKEAMTLISSQQNSIIAILKIIYERLHKQDNEILELLNSYDNSKSILHKIMHK